MQIVVLREDIAGERRVALVPETIKKLIGTGNEVSVESGAGAEASITDDAYRDAGAAVVSTRGELLAKAEILLAIDRPEVHVLDGLKANAVVISLLRPLDEPEKLTAFAERNLTAFSLELIPRTTRAQAMDVLSSMATVAGYKAVLWAAEQLPKMLPMMTTAAGTIPPAKVLVIGAGVAGLQAIATARRLGAVVEGFDIRAAAGEAVRSLGAKFLEMAVDAEGEGGYAKEIGEKEMNQARDLIAKSAATTDCIITTAQIPGRPAPLLITRAAVEAMRSGSVIVDLAGANGGNCELTVADREVQHQGVTIYAPTRFAATIPVHASQLFSRNIFAFLSLLIKEGKLELNLADDILAGSCVVHQGEIVNAKVKELIGRLTNKEAV
jgi:NAD(P) transhydrogenase subunit alpha